MIRFDSATLLAALFCGVFSPSYGASVGDRTAATYDGGRISDHEISLYAETVGYPYPDPVEASLNSREEAVRNDAAAHVVQAAEEILWNRHYAAKALADDFQLSAPLQAELKQVEPHCLAEKWAAHETSQLTTLSLEQAQDLLERHSATFHRPEARVVSYIFRATTGTEEASKQAARELEAVREQIASGSLSFIEAARRFSEAPSARQGGEIGIVTKQMKYNPRFMDLIFSTPPGSISPVTQLHNGYYLVKIGEVHPELNPSGEDLLTSPALAGVALQILGAEKLTSVTQEALAAYPGADRHEALAALARDRGFRADECTTRARFAAERVTAHYYFVHLHQEEWEPAEAEIRDYYTSYPEQMKDEGLWKLTRFVIPLQHKPGAPVKTGEEAMRHARRVLEEARGTSATDHLLEKYADLGLEVQTSLDWIHTTDHGPSDREILKLEPGQYTDVLLMPDGAGFYRLDAERELPLLPLEKKRDYIRANLIAAKADAMMKQSRRSVAEQMNLQVLLPGAATDNR